MYLDGLQSLQCIEDEVRFLGDEVQLILIEAPRLEVIYHGY